MTSILVQVFDEFQTALMSFDQFLCQGIDPCTFLRRRTSCTQVGLKRSFTQFFEARYRALCHWVRNLTSLQFLDLTRVYTLKVPVWRHHRNAPEWPIEVAPCAESASDVAQHSIWVERVIAQCKAPCAEQSALHGSRVVPAFVHFFFSEIVTWASSFAEFAHLVASLGRSGALRWGCPTRRLLRVKTCTLKALS